MLIDEKLVIVLVVVMSNKPKHAKTAVFGYKANK